MKKLTAFVSILFSVVILASGTAFAEHYWKLDIFQPTGPITGNTFNIEYKVLSVEENDDFEVDLLQNDVVIATQNTTKDFGDSGVFDITVPGPGTYKYKVSATSSVDATTQTTDEKTLEVKATPEGAVTTIFVNQGAAGTGAGGAGGAGGVATGDAQTQGAQDGANQGTVNADGSSTDTKVGGEVSGETDKKDDNNDSLIAWIIILAAIVLLVGYANRAKLAKLLERGEK